MRNSTKPFAIYVVIGIGLLIVAATQLRRGNEASNASFVANSNPFEALNDYQPADSLANVGKDLVKTLDTPPISVPTVQLDEIVADLPVETPFENFEGSNEIETSIANAAKFVNTFKPEPMETPDLVEMPASPAEGDDSFYDLGFDSSQQLQTQPYEEPADAESFDLAVAETEEMTQEPPATIERISTNMPAFGSLGKFSNQDQQRVITNHMVTPSSESGDASLQSTRWKKNPFLTDTPVEQTQPAETTAVDVLPPSVEAMIQAEFNDTPEELLMVANLEPTSEIPSQMVIPSVDHETMRSVIASDENLESGSPPIKMGISQADAQKAVHNIEYGKSLSRRGASYAARQEFYSSLRILAQSHDKQLGGTNYTQALRKGILAIKEAQDFIVTDTEAQIGLSVPNVIETHSTKIISAESAQGMTAIEAAQRYFSYASHQLSRCGGQNVVAAEALYCLGKLHSVQAKSGTISSKLDLAKSMIFHQAAISADGSNFRSLNELGVLYANNGRFEESKQMLKRSLRIKALPQAWQNLSVIHQRMGENQLADLANREFEMGSSQAANSVIRWAPAEEFNENAPLIQRTASQATALLPDSSEANSGKSSLKSLGDRILNSIR